ncbi:MAG: hypothetical protein P4L55_02960 [Syntrophobacteraceae bacterium]|nr:hypothetical protein [Syntrophobacteraceae bacterium]
MSIRVQVILDEEELSKFKAEASRESKSLSAWLRDAGRSVLAQKRAKQMAEPEELRLFFEQRQTREKGMEPEWDEHKKLIAEGMKGAERQS